MDKIAKESDGYTGSDFILFGSSQQPRRARFERSGPIDISAAGTGCTTANFHITAKNT